MAPKREEVGPIPTGWASKTIVQKNCSKVLYYCPATGQQFDSYFGLMHYVNYAIRNKLSIYEPCYKSVKRNKSLKKREQVIKSRKTSSILSLMRKQPSECSSSSSSSIAEQTVDSASSNRSQSSKSKKDDDYVPEPEFS